MRQNVPMFLWRRVAAVVVLVVGLGLLPATPGVAGGRAPAAVAAFPPVAAVAASQPAVRGVVDCIVRTNRERVSRNLVPLTADARLATAAILHSDFQAVTQRITHDEPAPRQDGGKRSTAAGYPWMVWAENVAVGQPNCAALITAWMGSSTHRANILDPRFRHIGIGTILGANGSRYWTMVLAAGG
jgi:hypothetical protein